MLIYLIIMILFLYFIYTNFDFEYFENNKISDKYIKKNTYLKPFIPLHSDYPNTILEKYNNSHHLKAISDINIGDAITIDYKADFRNNFNNLKIGKSMIHGYGLLANENIKKNTILLTCFLNKRVIFLGNFVNHSKKYKNTSTIENGDRYYLIADRDINKNEELFADYDLTPDFIKNSNPLWNK